MTTPDATQLHAFLVEHFNLEELKTLCFNLGVEYDDLGGEGRFGKARELVLFAERRDRLADLRAIMDQWRPNLYRAAFGDAATHPDIITPTNADLRQFILQHFTDSELTALAFDYFPDLFDEFSVGMTMSRKAIALISYVERRDRRDELWAVLSRERPETWGQRFSNIPVQTELRPTPTSVNRNPRQVFISHATADAAFAHRLAKYLRVQGWQVWIAPDSIRPGENWGGAFEHALETSGVYVVAMTPAAVTSRWVRMETEAAINLEHQGQLRFIPLFVTDCKPPLAWTQYQYVDFRTSYERGLAVLLPQLGTKAASSSLIAPRRQAKLVLLGEGM